MRRRIDLAGALVHRPKVLFLDEPTTGLDPQSRLAIWDHLRELNRQSITIFLTTQMMEEADRLCERIAIIDQGKIVALGTPQALKAQVGGDVVSISLDSDGEDGLSGRQEAAIALVQQRSYVEEAFPVDGGISVGVQDGGGRVPDLLRLLSDNNVFVSNLSLSRPTLDDVFLKFTGRNIRSDYTNGDEYGQVARHWMGLGRR
jgi:ABC-2 type transport system ATP-binding protein